MYIRRLKIDGFGCLAGLDWEFPPGGVLVLGPNESGKSTLVEGIETLLFGRLPAESEPWRPWFAEEFAGELELADPEGALVIRRAFSDNRLTVRLLDAGGSEMDQLGPLALSPRARKRERGVYESWLRRALGVDSADLFRRTLYLPQSSLEVDLKDLDGLLRSYLIGAGLDVEAVTTRLKERRRSVGKLSSEGRAHPGELDRLRDELTRLQSELQQARRREEHLRNLRSEISQLETSLAEKTRELERLDSLLADAEQAGRLRTDIRRLDELIDRDQADLREDGERRRRLRELEEALSREGDLAARLEEVRTALTHWERTAEAVQVAEARLKTVAEAGPRAPQVRLRCAGAAVAAAVLFGLLGGVLLGWWGALVGAGLGAVAGLLLARWLLVQRPRAAEVRLRRSDLAEAQAEAARAAEALSALLPGRPSEEWPGLGEHLDRIEEGLRQKADLERGLLGPDDLESLGRRLDDRRAERERLSKELASLEKRLAEAGLAEEQAQASARSRREELRRARDGSARRLQALREEAAEVRGTMGRPSAVLAEEVEDLEERERELALRFEALRAAERLWPEAVVRFQETYLERYAERVGLWLKELSGGGYDAVRMESSAEAPEVRSTRDGRWVPLERLSQGARDRLYIALRLALAEVMGEQGVRGPLILDDPFVTFDAQRLADAFETLRRVAETRQVILLAHDDRYRELGWEVRELPFAGPGE